MYKKVAKSSLPLYDVEFRKIPQFSSVGILGKKVFKYTPNEPWLPQMIFRFTGGKKGYVFLIFLWNTLYKRKNENPWYLAKYLLQWGAELQLVKTQKCAGHYLKICGGRVFI